VKHRLRRPEQQSEEEKMANSVAIAIRDRKKYKAPTAANLVHNSGLRSAVYWLDKKPHLFQSSDAPKNNREANEKWRNWVEKIEENYREKRGRKLRNDAVRIEEGLIVVGKDVQGRDDPAKVLRFTRRFIREFERKYDTEVLHWSLHNHEGKSKDEPNIHIHFLFANFGHEAQNVRNSMTKRELSNLQTMAWEAAQPFFPGIKRATNYAAQGKKAPKQVHHRKFRQEKEKEGVALAKVQDIKAENARLRAQLQEMGAKREHYAKLEAEIKELRKEAKAKELTEKELKRRIERLEKEVERWKAATKRNAEIRERAKMREEEARKEIEVIKAQTSQIMEQLEEAERVIEALNMDLLEAEEAKKEADRKAQEAQEAKKTAQARVGVLEEENEALRADIRKKDRIIETLKGFVLSVLAKLGLQPKDGRDPTGPAIEAIEELQEAARREEPGIAPSSRPRPRRSFFDDDEDEDQGMGWGMKF
jgi:hypothetical protein